MLLVLDNYDSFTYNIVQYVGELGTHPAVHRNDAISVAEVLALAPRGIIVSPGPGTPAEAGISVPLVREAIARRIPLLGVCLGHQAIGEAAGGAVVRAGRLMHGKTTEVVHDGTGVLAGLPSPFTVMRYHSLVIAPDRLPADLLVTGWSGDRDPGAEIMAVRHRHAPVHGVQFHPESVGTPHGKRLLANFLVLAGFEAGEEGAAAA
jgi:anthranilate synthase/aminodeoxychorismate synthase-like glutamine amidotransferase